LTSREPPTPPQRTRHALTSGCKSLDTRADVSLDGMELLRLGAEAIVQGASRRGFSRRTLLRRSSSWAWPRCRAPPRTRHPRAVSTTRARRHVHGPPSREPKRPSFNLPFLPAIGSDRRLGSRGFPVPDGTRLRLDNRSKVDYAGPRRRPDERSPCVSGRAASISTSAAARSGGLRDRDPGGLVETQGEACMPRRGLG